MPNFQLTSDTIRILPIMAAVWVLAALSSFSAIFAQDDELSEKPDIKTIVEKALLDPPDCKKMLADGRVWIHRDEQAVLVDGYVCQRNAPLEMFACPTGTKEHESIVAVFARSRFVHAALLAVGGVPGKPVAFEPKFTPASGTTVRIYVLWHDEDGNTQGTLAQNWVRQTGKNKAMEWDWVFAGSKIYKDPDTGKENYLGDGGELVCVANFMTSTLDVAVKSDAANSGLVFDAFTERIPKRETPVRLAFVLSDESPYAGAESEATGVSETEESKVDSEKRKPGKSNSDKSDSNEPDARGPKHLGDPVPERILKFLPGRKP
ncbi:MAG: hypothetical protein FJ308_10890 [Planctomycetes bacterium]|nr:hypothetical protein [Planctomycetota bacterium]